jgi:hypothetical protein
LSKFTEDKFDDRSVGDSDYFVNNWKGGLATSEARSDRQSSYPWKSKLSAKLVLEQSLSYYLSRRRSLKLTSYA